MRFEYWPVLFGLLLIPIFHFKAWRERAKPARVRYSLPIPESVALRSPMAAILGFRYVALALLIVAAARPQQGYQQTERTVSGIDIMMVMDVSASMGAEDLAERNRLEIAKETMEHFVSGRQNDRIGLVIFSGEPITLAPPTLDYAIIVKALRDAEMGVLKDGTAIGDGLALAVNRLRNSTAKSRVVVLLTDGDNNVGQVGPADAGELAAGYDIRVYTIAIGKEGKVRIPLKRKNAFGGTSTTYIFQDNALNTQLLEFIAQRTNGKFYRVQDLDTLQAVFKEIDQLEKSEIKATQKTRYTDWFHIPLQLGLLLLVLETLLPAVVRRWRTVP